MAQTSKQAKRRKNNRQGACKTWVHGNPLPYAVRKQMRKIQKQRNRVQ